MTNNYPGALEMGAFHQRTMLLDSDGWRTMDSAPKDGTVIELKCTYGVAPWYGLYRWTATRTATLEGETFTYETEPAWVKHGNDSSGVAAGDRDLRWRPAPAALETYVDPTGGLQEDMAYWRGAISRKYGYPLDHFEALAAQDVKAASCASIAMLHEPTPWQRLRARIMRTVRGTKGEA